MLPENNMQFKEEPENFNKRFDIVGCFMVHEDKFLLLHRHAHKANGGKWGLPAGKVDVGEGKEQAVLREIEEETGLVFKDSSVQFFDSRYVRDGDFDIEWHMFSTHIQEPIYVTINPHEHKEFRWVTPEESLQMNLIHDLPQSIKLFFKLR